MRYLKVVSVLLLLLMTASVAAQSAPEATPETQASEAVFLDFDPANFDNPTVIDNEWYALKPGDFWAYDGTTVQDGEEVTHRIEFTVTDLTKVVGDVTTVVAWIVDFSNGEAVEKELAFYAQDNDGHVWFLGEHPVEFEGGEVIAAKPWLHGIQEARAGIRMLADPQLDGISYAQGLGPAVGWTDRWSVEEMGLEKCVPVATDCYKDVMLIAETSESEPDIFQLKYYARGVGNIQVEFRGADKTQEELLLTEYEQLSPEALQAVRAEALAFEEQAYELSLDVYALTEPSQVAESGS
jgi:hypothetical protein